MENLVAVNNYNLVEVINSVSKGTTKAGIAEVGTSHSERGEHFTELRVLSPSPTNGGLWSENSVVVAWDTALHPFVSPDGTSIIHMVRNEDVMFVYKQ